MNIAIAMQQSAAIGTVLESRYQDISPLMNTNYDTPLQLLRAQLCDVLIVDDRSGNPTKLLQLVEAGLAKGIPVLVSLSGPALHEEPGLRDRGASITNITDPEEISRWIAATLGLVSCQHADVTVLATASAKGGASKTTLACLLAEALAYRGERVLLWEADLSNAAIRQHYGFGSDARPYTELADPNDRRGWTTDSVASYLARRSISIRDRQVELSFLLGPSNAATLQDMERHQWNALHEVITQLPFTTVIVDTGPEILRRPTALQVLDAGGYALVPCPTGILEREGAANLLTTIREWNPQALQRCGLVFVEPEKGAVSLKDLPAIRQLAEQNFGAVSQLGLLPRDARALSSAAQLLIERGTYVSPLDIAPHSRLARATWQLTDALALMINTSLEASAPRSSWFQRTFRRNTLVELPPTSEQLTEVHA